jgi:hypothetical protein
MLDGCPKDSQWHALYPILTNKSLFSFFARAMASSPHVCHATGLEECARTYGLLLSPALFSKVSFCGFSSSWPTLGPRRSFKACPIPCPSPSAPRRCAAIMTSPCYVPPRGKRSGAKPGLSAQVQLDVESLWRSEPETRARGR